jgi:glutathione S-transferase
MLELYQFELSHYSEKIRLILDYKGLEYRKIEVTPGVGQFELLRLSGQLEVPVLKDGNVIVSDSTAIAKYLDRQYPDRPILPENPKQRGLCLLMEEWADASIGLNGRTVLLNTVGQNPEFRTLLLPKATPEPLKTLVGAVPSQWFKVLGTGVGLTADAVKAAYDALQQDLEALCQLLAGDENAYLADNHPTLADFAVAGLSMYIKIPTGPYLDVPSNLRGQGIPGLANVSHYAPFFEWRDRLYAQYRQPLQSEQSTGGDAPTPIQVE